jgi:hypothetical protein
MAVVIEAAVDLIATVYWVMPPLVVALIAVAVLLHRLLGSDAYDCGVPGCGQPHNEMHGHDGNEIRRYRLWRIWSWREDAPRDGGGAHLVPRHGQPLRRQARDGRARRTRGDDPRTWSHPHQGSSPPSRSPAGRPGPTRRGLPGPVGGLTAWSWRWADRPPHRPRHGQTDRHAGPGCSGHHLPPRSAWHESCPAPLGGMVTRPAAGSDAGGRVTADGTPRPLPWPGVPSPTWSGVPGRCGGPRQRLAAAAWCPGRGGRGLRAWPSSSGRSGRPSGRARPRPARSASRIAV